MSETKAKKAPSTLELKRIARMEELLKTERVWWDQGMSVAGKRKGLRRRGMSGCWR